MKKNLIILLTVFTTLDLFSQINKGNFIVSIEGNYMKTNTQSGVTTNLLTTKGQYLSIGSSVGYLFKDRFVAGVGLDYNWDKETRSNQIYFNNFMQQEQMETKAHVFLPNIFMGFYFPITTKLYFNTNLKLSYGKVKSDYSTKYAGTGSIANSQPYMYGSANESKSDYFSALIKPEMTYFITSKFCLYLGLGGLEYSLIDWENQNSSLAVNFNPTYWALGIKFKI